MRNQLMKLIRTSAPFALTCATLFFVACGSGNSQDTAPKTEAPKKEETKKPDETSKVTDIKIVLKTTKGDIPATIFASKVPVTASNFLNLAKRGYYDGLTFHRVIPDFMIQGGDPAGTGSGGPGYQFNDEIHPSLKHTKGGIFSMANAGPNTNGSQFFITHKETPWLDGKHAVYGEVTGEGQKVVDAIVQGDRIVSIEIADSTDALFANQKDNLAKWNAVLDARKKP